MIKLTVDGKQIEVEEGTILLQACLDNDIFVPNLCFLKEMDHPPAACRMCFVEVEGESKPVTSCNLKVREGMVVKTDTDQVRDLQRMIFNLLFSAHHMDCKNCGSRKGCTLQKIGKHLGIRLKAKKLEELGRDLSVKYDHPCYDINAARCVLCYRCIYTCEKQHGVGNGVLKVFKKGFDTAIGSASQAAPETLPCKDCHACMDICPVSAITLKKVEQPQEAVQA